MNRIADCPDCGRCEPYHGSCPWCGGPVLSVGGLPARLVKRAPWLKRLRVVAAAKIASRNLLLPFVRRKES